MAKKEAATVTVRQTGSPIRRKPEQRATLLSFRGLLINFAYGVTTLAFGMIMGRLQQGDAHGGRRRCLCGRQ